MPDVARTEREHLRFSLALHQVLGAGGHGDGNSCCSPYSVASALGLISQGARGPAAEEIVALLAGADADVRKQAELLRAAAELAPARNAERPVIAVSNTLWLAEDLVVRKDFQTDLAEWPNGATRTAPFGTDMARAREQINADVSETTRGLIPELLAPGDISPDAVASLVNALYLRVPWTRPFAERDTHDQPFHTPSGPVRAPMMRQSERLGYAAIDGWQLVSLPAVGGVQAVVLLPDDLARRESTLDSSMLAELLGNQRETMVRLTMPRFELDIRSDLTSALNKLGVRTLFSPAADLSGLSDDPRLTVYAAVHQAVLRVNESGFEGAAATAMLIRMVSAPVGRPVEVRVDRPFLFLVRHVSSGAVYFCARITRP